MTDEAPKPPTPAEPSNQEKTEQRDAVRGQEVERLVEKLETLPQSTRSEVVEKLFMGVFRESGFPKLDPEVVKILSASVEKDNENKFQYLSQKQRDATEIKKRDQDQEAVRHKDRIKLLWPILLVALLCEVGLIGSGIWFISAGKEAIGVGFITAALSATFGYLGGLGTARFFKPK